MKTSLLAAIFIGVHACTWAQAPQGTPPTKEELSKPELPSGPLLGKPPDFSDWTVSFIYPAEASNKPAPGISGQARQAYLDSRPSKVMTTKTRRITHEITKNFGGAQTDFWYEGNTQYYQAPGQTQWLESSDAVSGSGAVDANYRPLPPSGFRDLDWINAENYAGSVPYEKGTYLVFVPGGYKKLDLRDVSKQKKLLESQPTVAYIDSDTRMPVAVRQGNVTRVFQFNSPPTATQTLPPDLSKAINDGKEARRRLELPAARPY